ncbi:MAG: DUF58 domain-containing protein [Polyangiales bacterium]
MYPIPTIETRWLGAALALALLVGSISGSVVTAALASAGLVLVAAVFASTVPLARRARADRLEFAWWIAGESGDPALPVVRAAAPFTVHCFFRHRGSGPIHMDAIEPVSAHAVGLDAIRTAPLEVPPGTRVEFALRLSAPSPGRSVLHGVLVRLRGPLGLFEMPLYFPNRLRVTVAPRRLARSRVRGTPERPPTRAAAHAQRRRGRGTELHELRDLRPGDPFRTIAWKTSARLGRLVVKEVEQEEHGTHRLVVDAAPSMRAGTPGRTRLDRALEVAIGEAEASLAMGDRVGVDVVDGRSIADLPPDDRPQQARKVLDTLVSAFDVVDEDLTEVDDAEVGRRVARYVRHQEGLDFSDGSEAGCDLRALAAHVAPRAERVPGKVRASTHEGTLLRRYAKRDGIPLPYRRTAPVGEKQRALVAALERIEARRLGPSRVTVLTDGEDLEVDETLRRAFLRLSRHGHTVRFVLVRNPEPPGRGDDALARAERRRAELEARRLRALAASLRRLGAAAELADVAQVPPSPLAPTETSA